MTICEGCIIDVAHRSTLHWMDGYHQDHIQQHFIGVVVCVGIVFVSESEFVISDSLTGPMECNLREGLPLLLPNRGSFSSL